MLASLPFVLKQNPTPPRPKSRPTPTAAAQIAPYTHGCISLGAELEEEEEEEEFITSGDWRGKHNLLSRGAGADPPRRREGDDSHPTIERS